LDGGVRITEIKSGIVAAQTRIREGFIVTGIDGETVKNGNELARKLKEKSGDNIILEGIYPSYPNKIYNYGLSL
jgi:S1-C subfamily serine protease